VRVFVAIDISDSVRAALRRFIDKVAGAGKAARWVRPEGMHLTLKFIGETPPAGVERIKEVLRTVRSSAPVKLHIHGIGFFPHERRPRVLWAGIESSENLAELAADLETRMAKLGIPAESRKFVPHFTLARFESPRDAGSLQSEIERLGPPDFGEVQTSAFHLFQSVLKQGGAEYTRLESFQFFRADD
jgi:RNA 2',3'-cyclic 3'-phosphodiesterase